MPEYSQLKNQMLNEAALILKSVNWNEKEINKKIKSLDEAQGNEELTCKLEDEISRLIKKLDREVDNMSDFIIKYENIIKRNKNEEKESIPNFGTKREVYLRGISKNSGRKKGS